MSEPSGREATPLDEPTWANGQPIGDEDAKKIALLRAAGCRCPRWPLLGTRTGVGPRCRMCNTVASS